ncbi:unnamed protein product [Boreogadus saida]
MWGSAALPPGLPSAPAPGDTTTSTEASPRPSGRTPIVQYAGPADETRVLLTNKAVCDSISRTLKIYAGSDFSFKAQ